MTIPNKLYFSISEVAEMTGVKPHVLRYWESEFPDLRPKKPGETVNTLAEFVHARVGIALGDGAWRVAHEVLLDRRGDVVIHQPCLEGVTEIVEVRNHSRPFRRALEGTNDLFEAFAEDEVRIGDQRALLSYPLPEPEDTPQLRVNRDCQIIAPVRLVLFRPDVHYALLQIHSRPRKVQDIVEAEPSP